MIHAMPLLKGDVVMKVTLGRFQEWFLVLNLFFSIFAVAQDEKYKFRPPTNEQIYKLSVELNQNITRLISEGKITWRFPQEQFPFLGEQLCESSKKEDCVDSIKTYLDGYIKNNLRAFLLMNILGYVGSYAERTDFFFPLSQSPKGAAALAYHRENGERIYLAVGKPGLHMREAALHFGSMASFIQEKIVFFPNHLRFPKITFPVMHDVVILIDGHHSLVAKTIGAVFKGVEHFIFIQKEWYEKEKPILDFLLVHEIQHFIDFEAVPEIFLKSSDERLFVHDQMIKTRIVYKEINELRQRKEFQAFLLEKIRLKRLQKPRLSADEIAREVSSELGQNFVDEILFFYPYFESEVEKRAYWVTVQFLKKQGLTLDEVIGLITYYVIPGSETKEIFPPVLPYRQRYFEKLYNR